MKPGTVVAGKYRIVEEIGQAKAGEKDLGDKDSLCLLGRLHPETLSVIARTAVMQYQKTKTLIDQIGRELNVGYVLGGSAQREGTRVWITAELIKVQDQTQLWSDSIEREMSGILALRNEVAQKVAGALTLKLLPAEQARLASARTVNPEAYEACLLGDSALKLTVADIESAMRYYELALEKEPNYAPAYIGISNVWACRQQMSLTPSSEAGPKAKAAAGREWEKSIELGPDDAAARATYSHYLMIVGRRDEAMRPIERAVELDPVEPHGTAFYAFVLPCAHRYDDSIVQARRALRLEPNHPTALNVLFLALHERGQHDEAIKAAILFYVRLLPDKPDIREAFERGYAEEGYAGAFRRAADFEVSHYAEKPGIAFGAAFDYMTAGDAARTLDWLEKAIAQHDPNASYVNSLPLWDSVRRDTRFRDPLRKMGLPADTSK